MGFGVDQLGAPEAQSLLDIEDGESSVSFLSSFRNLILTSEFLSRDSLSHYVDVAENLSGKVLLEDAQNEIYWLAATCWNKGRNFAIEDRHALGLEWLQVAIKLSDHSTDIVGHVDEMKESIKVLQDKI